MISLVLYGRNDTYGYNLHKRAAISLNCMAEILTDPADEIIFVDYNTPDDFPTFPEAIQDTLTAKAKQHLRILRVRPSLHERFRQQTHLVCLEPIARNVGIRHSNPSNRWILSTNTDMVFVPRRGKSLSEIVAELPNAYYHSPRFEVPETLWESVDRLDPRGTIEAFGRWGSELHLNEIVYAFHPDVRYDGPGDFQLILRDDLFRMHGFHESMLLGWHVDSNMARRLAFLKRSISDIIDDLYAYHCDHTRQVTPAHRPRGSQNDQKIYFENVERPDVPEQAKTWGLADEKIEEISLNAGSAYLAALRAAISEPLEEPTTLMYSGESFNRIDYPVEHVLPFLVDSIASYPRDIVLGWAGAKKSLLEGFARAWRDLGFTNPIQVAEQSRVLGPNLPGNCAWVSHDDLCTRCTVCVFDWGRPENSDTKSTWDFDRDPAIRDVMHSFRAIVRHERARLASESARPRRFIGINAINNAVEGIFNNHIGAALTPLATHIRQGFLSSILSGSARSANILPLLYAGQAGQKLQNTFVTLPETDGYVFYGPYLDLDSQMYRLTVEFGDVRHMGTESDFLGLEVASNSRLIAYREIGREDLATKRASLDFFISAEICDDPNWPRIEFRLRTPGNVELVVANVVLEETGVSADAATLREFDCVPFLMVGRAGDREGRTIRARPGVGDFVAYGPYFWLPAGHYEATFNFDITQATPGTRIRAYVASHLGQQILGRSYVTPGQTRHAGCTIEFDVSSEMPLPEEGLMEFLVHSGGRIEFALTAVRVKYVSAAPPMTKLEKPTVRQDDVLAQLTSGHAGARSPRAIVALQGAVGNVFSGDDVPTRGRQRFTLTFGEGSYSANGEDSGFVVAAFGRDKIIGYHEITMDEVRRGSSAFDFASDEDTATLRLRSMGLLEAEILSAVLSDTESRATGAASINFLKFLDIGRAGRWAISASGKDSIIQSVHGIRDVVAYGPYIRLAPGHYDVTFKLDIDGGFSLRPITLDVSYDLGRRIIARQSIWPFRSGSTTRTLSFAISAETWQSENLYEFRAWGSGRTNFAITGISMEQRALIGA